MGGSDKGLTHLQGRPMIEHVIDRLSPQLQTLVISANRNQDQYQQFGYPVISDGEGETSFLGPLAGIASAIQATETTMVLVSPCDTPLIPTDLVDRLHNTLQQSGRPIAVAHDGERLQQLCFLAQRTIADSIEQHLSAGERRVQRWIAALDPAICSFNDSVAFSNINTPLEQQQIEHALGEP